MTASAFCQRRLAWLTSLLTAKRSIRPSACMLPCVCKPCIIILIGAINNIPHCCMSVGCFAVMRSSCKLCQDMYNAYSVVHMTRTKRHHAGHAHTTCGSHRHLLIDMLRALLMTNNVSISCLFRVLQRMFLLLCWSFETTHNSEWSMGTANSNSRDCSASLCEI